MEYEQKYSRGKPVTTLTTKVLPHELKNQQGTQIKFWPDKEGIISPKPKMHRASNNHLLTYSQLFNGNLIFYSSFVDS